jgi:hypothetical protein
MTKNAILFHGTGQELKSFSEEKIGLGGDHNSALGVHATACPYEAGGYSDMSRELSDDESQSRILVLRYCYEKEDAIFSNNVFFGIDEFGDEEPESSHDHFHEMRKSYLEKGVDMVVAEFGEEPIFVLLKPENIKIIGSLTLQQAEELGDRLNDKALDRFDPEIVYREYRSLTTLKNLEINNPEI